MANRTAIVVVAGVGDEGSGEGAERIVEGLLRHGGWAAGDEVTEWYPVAGDILDANDHEARARAARRFTLRRPPGGAGPSEVDVYEFWWADMSRFPAALRSFVAAFLGLFLDMPAIARAALLGGLAIGRSSVPPVETGPQETSVGMRSRLAAAELLGTVGWLCAVPIMITTFLTLALVGLMTLALYLRSLGAPLLGWCLAIAAGGLVVSFVSVMAAHRYQRSGRAYALPLTVLALCAAAALVVWRIADRGGRPDLALGDAVVATVAFPFRILWLTLLLLTTLAVIALLARMARVWRGDRPEAGPAWRSSVTAVFTATAAPLGIAVLLAVISAGVGAASQPLTNRAEFTSGAPAAVSVPSQVPWCLSGPRDWSPSSRDCPDTVEPGDVLAAHDDPVLTAYAWGVVILGQALAPLVVAVAAAAAAVVVLLIAMALAFTAGRGEPRDPRTAARLTAILGLQERTLGPLLMLLVPVAAYVGAATWIGALLAFTADAGSDVLNRFAASAAVLAGGVAAAIIAARVLGVSPGALAGGGKASELLRSILDRPYDVATYLREHRALRWARPINTPRARMLARFSALLKHISRGGVRGPAGTYDRIIIAAHSQGTVLAVTLLHEPPGGLPAEVRLITFGCPLRQLYRQRLPRQFGWLSAMRTTPWRYLDQTGSHLREWVNLAAPGDPIGRTVFDPPPAPWMAATATHSTTDPSLTLVEQTLRARRSQRLLEPPRPLPHHRADARSLAQPRLDGPARHLEGPRIRAQQEEAVRLGEHGVDLEDELLRVDRSVELAELLGPAGGSLEQLQPAVVDLGDAIPQRTRAGCRAPPRRRRRSTRPGRPPARRVRGTARTAPAGAEAPRARPTTGRAPRCGRRPRRR